jgi:hypothetical protein
LKKAAKAMAEALGAKLCGGAAKGQLNEDDFQAARSFAKNLAL